MTRISSMRIAVLFLAGLFLVACGDDPVSTSALIGINVKTKGGDVRGDGVLSVDKDMKTDQQWKDFRDDTTAKLGRDPGDLELSEISLLLTTNSVGVSELNKVFDGVVDVEFVVDGSRNVYPVGSGTVDQTLVGRSLTMVSSFDYAAIQGVDRTDLLRGAFKVSMAGPAEANYASLAGEAEMQINLTFAAFE